MGYFDNSNKVIAALRVGFYCGIAGILVDLDHPISCILFPAATNRRLFHTPILVVCCVVLCSLIAYCGRLYVKSILSKEVNHGHI